MKFYIGSSFGNSEKVKALSEKLKGCGWEHTYDWTQSDAPALYTKEALAQIAALEQDGIREAEAVIILLPGGRGTHVELGMALALEKKIFLCAQDEHVLQADPVNFYVSKGIIHLIGTVDEVAKKIVQATVS